MSEIPQDVRVLSHEFTIRQYANRRPCTSRSIGRSWRRCYHGRGRAAAITEQDWIRSSLPPTLRRILELLFPELIVLSIFHLPRPDSTSMKAVAAKVWGLVRTIPASTGIVIRSIIVERLHNRLQDKSSDAWLAGAISSVAAD